MTLQPLNLLMEKRDFCSKDRSSGFNYLHHENVKFEKLQHEHVPLPKLSSKIPPLNHH